MVKGEGGEAFVHSILLPGTGGGLGGESTRAHDDSLSGVWGNLRGSSEELVTNIPRELP